MKEKYYIGIDLHKVIIQACVINSGGETVEEKRYRIGKEWHRDEIVKDLAK